MSETIKEQILAIRYTGLTNMFDATKVQMIALQMGFDELAGYIEYHYRDYQMFILTGGEK